MHRLEKSDFVGSYNDEHQLMARSTTPNENWAYVEDWWLTVSKAALVKQRHPERRADTTVVDRSGKLIVDG